MATIKHDWYQSDAKVVITVLIKNAEEKNGTVEIDRDSVQVKVDDADFKISLSKPIVKERSSYKMFKTKIEITLIKETGERWDALEQKVVKPVLTGPPPIHKKNWDSLAKEVEKTEEEDAKSEEALQKLFRKIYSTSTPEVQKAMNKSFQESGGTVLSTNWQEVGKEKVDVKPPDGCEFKKWE